MSKQTEALKLALEALENAWLDASMGKGDVARHTEAITAIREALAEQPAQQEPAAWMYDWICDGKRIEGWIAHKESEIPRLLASNIRPLYTTPQPARQEPVAIIASLMPAERHTLLEEGHSLHDSLYTSPPAQRKPLTDEEIYKIANDLFYGNGPCDTLAMCRAIEAAHGIKENT